MMGLVRQMTNKQDEEKLPIGSTNVAGTDGGLGGPRTKEGYDTGRTSSHIETGQVKRVNGSGSGSSNVDSHNGTDWA